MENKFDLPEPSAEARDHSHSLTALIRERINDSGGWIDFAEYMSLALYAPGLGYYSAGSQKFGPAGDFVTAPEISPLFSRCLARSVGDVLQALDDLGIGVEHADEIGLRLLKVGMPWPLERECIRHFAEGLEAAP